MGKAIEQAGGFDQIPELSRFVQAKGGRFIRHHVKTAAQRRLGDGKMHVIGSHYGDKLHPLLGGHRRLGRDHLPVIVVNALLWQVQCRP